MPKTKKQGFVVSAFLALVLAEIFWGINTPVIKVGLQNVRLPLYLSITLLGSAALIAPFAIRRWKPLLKRDYALLIIGSIISITLGNVVLLMGLERVPSLNAPLIGLFGPLVLFVLSAEFLKEKLSLKTFIGILVAFIGGAICIGVPWQAAAVGNEYIVGNLLLVLATLCTVIGTLVCKPVLKRGSAHQVTFIHLLAGITPVALFSLQYVDEISISQFGPEGSRAIVFNAVAVALANLLFMYGLQRKKAQEVGLYAYIHPLVTAVAAWVILSEAPSGRIMLGAVFIFLGLYIAEFHTASIKRVHTHKTLAHKV